MSPRLSLRIDFPDGVRLGPGKVALLEAIGRTRSISAAGRSLGMSYRRAWLLVDAVNRAFEEPVVVTRPGRRDGGAELTALGARLVALYRTVERRAAEASAGALAELAAARVPMAAGDAETDVSRAG
ncbi:MAG: winged helix-turn-helix domain-containing protein [Rhodospirillales bacterium]|jgi:molybdate transport system regulatory protein